MGETGQRRLTYDDLLARPETMLREELIDGELVLSPSPSWSHQRVVRELVLELGQWSREHGGEVGVGPVDVLVDRHTVVQPDVFAYAPGAVPEVLERPLRLPPSLAVEVLSPSNRSHDLVRKRAIYERFGVRELWFVDVGPGIVEQVVATEPGTFGPSRMYDRASQLVSQTLPGLCLEVVAIVGPLGD